MALHLIGHVFVKAASPLKAVTDEYERAGALDAMPPKFSMPQKAGIVHARSTSQDSSLYRYIKLISFPLTLAASSLDPPNAGSNTIHRDKGSWTENGDVECKHTAREEAVFGEDCDGVDEEDGDWRLPTALIPTVIFLHLICAPYTKVEESFNIQATHDILNYGVRDFFPLNEPGRVQLKDHYDHFTFTGPVPRTFVGALALAGVSWPFTRAIGDAVNQQTIVRAVLGLWNAACLLYYRNGVAQAFGRNPANWFVLFQASGFHLMYYTSRTLPNSFAFGLATIAFGKLLPVFKSPPASQETRRKTFLTLLTMTGVIFRSELALLLIPNTLQFLLRRELSLLHAISSGLLGLCIGISFTVPIDSLLWQRFPLWPELSAFSYNILHSQSSNWGTSPWHFYLTSALPRLLFNPLTYLLCIPLSFTQPALRHTAANLVVPNLAFVLLYSFQPHKEWRFIIYTIPPLLTVAALGANWIWARRTKTFTNRLLALALIASVLASSAASTLMLALSHLNYPGAHALNRIHALAPTHHAPGAIVHVHMDTLSCMTGITRFLQLRPPSLLLPLPPPPSSCLSSPHGSAAPGTPEEDATATTTTTTTTTNLFYIYDKSENETQLLDPLFWARFDWALAESVERVIGRWVVEETVDAYAGVRIVRPGEVSEESSSGDLEDKNRGGAREMARRGKGVKGIMDAVERYGRRATGGWWVRVVMEPRIRVLRREREVIGMGMGMGRDW
ncbi:MAG: hypothetical protein Q9173_004535 [Seirophora scorigena]